MQHKLLISGNGEQYKEVICSDKQSFEFKHEPEVMIYKGLYHVFESEIGEQLMVQLPEGDHGLVVGVEYEIKL